MTMIRPVPAAGVVVDFATHPVAFRRRLLQQVRSLQAECATAQRRLRSAREALVVFQARLEEQRARLDPVRADSAATLSALESGDVAEMERVRDSILRRLT